MANSSIRSEFWNCNAADCVFKGLRYTLLRMELGLGGTAVGANNRLDLLKLVTTGVNKSEVNDHGDYMLRIVEGWEENETHDPDVPAISHSRGLTPFVFVPFEEVLLPIEGFIP
ncbi:F-box protein 7-like isoform X2 [Musa acuminata AAA Group]|uniref:F-box protein 7-like isoform X2 n=1 Tax=Musa acuminata AAA Group TaxID=214697 RepID=UPI0031CF6EEC